MLSSNLSFNEEPFRLTPDQRLPYQSFAFQDAHQQLFNAIREGRGPLLLTGEAGTGKTLLMRVLKRELELIGATVCFPSLVHASWRELLSACLRGADIDAAATDSERLLSALKEWLNDRLKAHMLVAVLVDDTQDLDDALLETLATLWSLQADGRSLLPMVVVGQPGVEGRLRPYLADNKPIALEVCLQPLEAWEIRPFILHRLRAAGHHGSDPFAAAAYALIQERSKGVPRRINLLCGTALMLASLEDRNTVTAEDVEQALRDNWLDNEQATGFGAAAAPAKDALSGKSNGASGAPTLSTDSWVERLQRTSGNRATRAVRHAEDQRTQTMPVTRPLPPPLRARQQEPHRQLENEPPTAINATVSKDPTWPDEKTHLAPVPNDDDVPLSLGSGFHADKSDAFHRVGRAPTRVRKWRWVKRPLLAIAGLAGGVLIGGLVATHYPNLTDTLKAQFRDLVSYVGLAVSNAKTSEQASPQPASNEDPEAGQVKDDEATAYSNLALLYQTRGDLDQAERLYQKALEIHKALGHRESMARDLNNLGYVYWSRGNLQQAEAVYRESLELHKALGKQAGMADNYANLGSVYWTRRDLPRAEAMYRQALALNEALGRQEKLANNYGNLGVVYQTRGNLQQAQAMHREAIAIYERAGRQTEGLANAYGNLGSVYKRAGNLKEAEAMYVRALRLYQRVGNQAQANRAQALIRTLREASNTSRE